MRKRIEKSVAQGDTRRVRLGAIQLFGSEKAVDGIHMWLTIEGKPMDTLLFENQSQVYRIESHVVANSFDDKEELTHLMELAKNYQSLTGAHLPIPFKAVDDKNPYISFRGDLLVESATLKDYRQSLSGYTKMTLNVARLEEHHDMEKKEHAVVLSESAWTSVLKALNTSGLLTFQREEVDAFKNQLQGKLKGEQ